MHRLGPVAVACAAGCQFASTPAQIDAAPSDAAIDAAIDAPRPDGAPGSGRRKRITIDAGRVSGDHAGFPVWLQLDDAELGARARADGADIYFTRADGTPLEWELQRWDKATNRLDAWVRVDLDDDMPTVFDLRYGDPGPAHAPNAPLAFAGSFAAVWHLESPTAVPDATGTHPGTPVNLGAGHGTPGRLGRGIRFGGPLNEEVRFANPLTGGGAHTISLWVDQTTTTDNDALVVLGNGTCGESRFLHGRFQTPTVAVGFYCNDWTTPNINVVNAGWTLIHWVYTGGVSTLYRDGAVAAGPFTHSGTAVDTRGNTGRLGSAPAPWGQDMGAHAGLDEVRIATVARDQGYIVTEYNNQSSPATFYDVGPELGVP